MKAGRCNQHRYPDRTGPVNPKYSSSAWKKVRELKLRQNPLCEDCLELGIIEAAQCVDHRDGNPDNDSPSNLRSLSLSCHARKTATVDHGWANKSGELKSATGLDGWPIQIDRK